MFMTNKSALMTPQNATLDSKRTLSWFVSFRRLSSQFQFSLSIVTLEYLSQWLNQREKERGNRGEYRSQRWVENTNMSECTHSINSINACRQIPLQVNFFKMTTFCIYFYEFYLSTIGGLFLSCQILSSIGILLSKRLERPGTRGRGELCVLH